MKEIKLYKKPPPEMQKIIESSCEGIDFTLAVSQIPMMLILALETISEIEEQALNKCVELGAVVINNVPFLTLMYEGLSFSCSVCDIDDINVLEDAIKIVAIDKSNELVRSVRIVELDKRLLIIIADGLEKITYAKEEAQEKIQEVYDYFSAEDIHTLARAVQVV
jgi:hypothetical protein